MNEETAAAIERLRTAPPTSDQRRMEPTISAAKAEKIQLEKQIRLQLEQFSDSTGLAVCGVGVDPIGVRGAKFYHVEAKVEL